MEERTEGDDGQAWILVVNASEREIVKWMIGIHVGRTRERLRAGSFASWSRTTMSSFSDPTLFGLVRAYSALKHPRSTLFPSHLPFLQVHDFVLSYILLNPHLLQYPPSVTYQLSFWKWVIEHLEILLGDEAWVLLPFTNFMNYFYVGRC